MAVTYIKDPTLWTLDSGLEVEGSFVSLQRYEDYFDDFTIDSVNIGAVTSGSGSLTARGGLFVYSSAATDAALWHLKQAIDDSAMQSHTVRLNITDIGTSAWPFMVRQGAGGAPELDAGPAPIALLQFATDQWGFSYRKADGSYMYWNETTGAWQTGVITFAPIDYTHAFEVFFEQTGTQWRIRVRDLTSETTLAQSTLIPWADIYDSGEAYYLCGGDYATTGSAITMTVISVWKNYPLTAQTATMGQLDFNGIFDQFPVTHELDSGASITWQYNKDAEGWVQPGAGQPSDIEAALGGLFIGTLDLRATLLSDAGGEDLAAFDIGSGVLGGIGASFNMPMETLSLNELEVVEL